LREKEELTGDPLSGGLKEVGRWSWVFDWEEQDGGGFTSGEILLRSDGLLLRRSGGSSYDPRKKETTWNFGPWEVIADWQGGAEADHAIRWLKGQRYGLSQPSPTPPDSPEFKHPGAPKPARYL